MKPWYQSGTIIGGLVMMVTFIFRQLGWTIDTQMITDVVTSLVATIGLIMVIVGRIRATKKIK
jgi:uncharacterized membrane protein